jgi:hypothetical protein
MAAELLITPSRAQDANANNAAGAKWYLYATGTTTPQTVYADAAFTTPLTNPVVADSGGKFPAMYLDSALIYRGVLTNSDGSQTFYDIDPINSAVLAQLSSDLASTANNKGAGLVGYSYSATYADGTAGKKLQQSIDLDDFPGATDHAKLTTAVAFCKATGIALNLPSRQINIDTSLGSITLEEVTLQGEYVLDGANSVVDKGAMLWITGTANSPFKIRRGVTIQGVGFYYPNQTDSAAPTTYAPTLAFDFTNGAVQFVNICRNVVYNAYRFCDIDDAIGRVGHVEITDNYICALNRGVYITYNLEIIRIERNNFTFGLWLAATEAGARAYMRANASAIVCARSDGIEFNDNLIFGHLNGLFTATTGLCQLMHITQNKFDQVRYPINANGTGNFSGVIAANTFNAFNNEDHTLQGVSINITTTGVARETIVINGNNFALATESHLYTAGDNPTRNIAIGVNTWLSWASFKAAGTHSAISANGALTNVSIVGGYFIGGDSGAYSYGIGGVFNTLNCTGVTFDLCHRAISAAVNYATGSGNVSFATSDTSSDVITAGSLSWGPNNFDKPHKVTGLQMPVAQLGDYANDAAAAAGGVSVGGFYVTASAVKQRRT